MTRTPLADSGSRSPHHGFLLLCCSNSWFPPSRYSIGTFDGLRYSPLSQGILGGDSDYVPKSGADESNHGRRFLCAHSHHHRINCPR